MSSIFSHVPEGKRLGPPEDRLSDPLDTLVLDLIESLPAHTRMYPDLYAWAIVDLLREHSGGPHRDHSEN